MFNLPRSTPEKQDIASGSISLFLEHIAEKGLELHSFMLLRNGQVVSEGWWHPYSPELPHMLFSLSKSFTSTAIGLAAAEGLLTVDDQVISFFEDCTPKEVDPNLAKMKVKHLLSMSTGHEEDTTGKISAKKNWVKAFLELPVEREPGTHFVYNSGASYMLSAIVQKVTGQTVLDYLMPSLFEPLGIENPTWETCPMGINTGGWGLSIRTEDIAKFGQLYLQEGRWQDKQLLTKEWVREATRSHISNGDCGDSDWSHGYGYQFWRCRHDVYRGDGAFGQYCVVMPKYNAVLAITSGLSDMQAVLNLVWEDLLPGMSDGSLPEDKAAFEKLQQTTKGLALLPQKENLASPIIPYISGKRYVFEKNDYSFKELIFKFESDRVEVLVQMRDKRKEIVLNCGISQWVENPKDMLWYPGKSMASCTWRNDRTLSVTVRFIETPFSDTYRFTFNEDDIEIESSINVSFGQKEKPVVCGRAVTK